MDESAEVWALVLETPLAAAQPGAAGPPRGAAAGDGMAPWPVCSARASCLFTCFRRYTSSFTNERRGGGW